MTKFLTTTAIIFSINATYAQKNVPIKALSDFKIKFPKAQKVNWDKEINGKFDVEFKLNEKNLIAKYSPIGEWLETDLPIEVAKIPPGVGASFKREHTKAKIKLVYKIETAKQFKYKIEYKEDSKTQEIIYDIDGKVMK